MDETRTSLLDNPLLVKHVRSRLRRQHVLPMIVVLAVVGSCILWGGFALHGTGSGAIFSLLAVLQGGILLLAGTTQVWTAVARASSSGILDFHRASPLPPRTVAIGFLLGAPIRELVAFAVLAPCALVAAGMGRPGLVAGACVLALTLLSALLFFALAMVAGLLIPKPRRGGGVGALVVLACVLSPLVERGYALPGLLTPVPAFREAMRSAGGWFAGEVTYPTFFGVAMPLAVQSLVYQVPLLVFLMIAATRRMRSARAHPYSKRSGVLLLMVLVALAMGGMVGHPDVRVEMAVPALLCVTVLLACVVALAVTPDRTELAAGLRRAARLGGSAPPPWEDSASNRVVVAVLAAITAAAGAATAQLVPRGAVVHLPLAMGIAAATVALFGWALQYFAMAFGRRALPYFLLFLFATWVVPLLIGSLLGYSVEGGIGRLVTHLCPIVALISPDPVSLGFLGVLAAVFWLRTVACEKAAREQLSGATDPIR